MGTHLVRTSFVAVACLMLWVAMGCSERSTPATLEEAFLDYEKYELTTFNVSGEARCPSCGDTSDLIGLQVDIYLKEDPLNDLAVETLDGLGHFDIDGIRTYQNVTVVVRGRLYWDESSSASSLTAYTEFQTPSVEEGSVAITLDFPSSKPD